MSDQTQVEVVKPARALARKYLEPILFLGDRMAIVDGENVPKERKILDWLADGAGIKSFRHEKWYREMNEQKAIAALDIDSAKMGALVTISLVLKADFERKDAEFELFTKLRKMLKAAPIAVPIDLDEHKALAMKYFSQR
ncbi:MAG: hypothetical protein OEW12_06290 [Deltaproteobacteria bacterium]|nr:hypothetical protein [Deltaproteobacteria bacterium]